MRSTGGLRDTVHDFGGDFGNGYDFRTYNAYDMLDAVRRAREDFFDKKEWKHFMELAMGCDFSWGRSANQYISLYKDIQN